MYCAILPSTIQPGNAGFWLGPINIGSSHGLYRYWHFRSACAKLLRPGHRHWNLGIFPCRGANYKIDYHDDFDFYDLKLSFQVLGVSGVKNRYLGERNK